MLKPLLFGFFLLGCMREVFFLCLAGDQVVDLWLHDSFVNVFLNFVALNSLFITPFLIFKRCVALFSPRSSSSSSKLIVSRSPSSEASSPLQWRRRRRKGGKAQL